MKPLLLNASPAGGESSGYRLASELLAALGEREVAAKRDFTLIERHLGSAPLPAIDADYARAVTSRALEHAAFELSERLIAEIEATDLLFINTPMHNFNVPAALKLWIDYVLRIQRTFASTPEGKVGLMRDRPTFVMVSSGGLLQGERARQPDFLTPYLRYALGSIGIRSVEFFVLDGLVLGDAWVEETFARVRSALLDAAPFR